jgi:hypothetical protein
MILKNSLKIMPAYRRPLEWNFRMENLGDAAGLSSFIRGKKFELLETWSCYY